MPISNEELVRKAIITTDALATAGKLNPAQADKFIDYVIDESVLKNNARIVKFTNETLEINKIGVGKRVAMPAAEAVAPTTRRGVTPTKISLTPKEIIVPFEIGQSVLEINIEGTDVEDHIIKMMARALSNDLEELYILGDVSGPAILEGDYIEGGSSSLYVKDGYLALLDGWSKLADSAHVVDAAGTNMGLSVLGEMIRAMPTKFQRARDQLRWFMSTNLLHLYAQKLSTRATNLGDAASSGAMHTPFGIKAVPVPLWALQPQTVKHLVLTDEDAISTGYAPISNVVVTTNTLGMTPEAAYVLGVDYSVDGANGTVARIGAGSIGNGDTVKVTFNVDPQILLTQYENFIVAIGRDISIEKDRDIMKRVNQYAIHTKVDVKFEETDAVVKAKNIGTGI